jgi:NAD(P)-dependent dehydrogenase (short-subunit alcohol dehydrogenase family)
MTAEQRCSLEGRVAIVTGAGRGLGRAYALALGRHGARVVVNNRDTRTGSPSDSSVAQAVVDEIRTAGGTAIANHADVVEAGFQLVDHTIDAFGRVDIIVNNAGILKFTSFGETTLEEFERHWRSHLAGHVNVTHAAWPLLLEQGYGRVIMVGSGSGLYGLRSQSCYAAAKGAVHGLMRTLALEGRDSGVLVNSIYPGGYSRMVADAELAPGVAEWMKNTMPAELVAPMVVWLASDQCSVSGQAFSVWAGRVARVVIGSGRGLIDQDLTPQLIEQQYATISSAEGLHEPIDAVDEGVNKLDMMAPQGSAG